MRNFSCDVLIAGGGVAGISAALAAARNGADVILLEKQCVLGGLATSGLITIYLPLCDGRGTSLIRYGFRWKPKSFCSVSMSEFSMITACAVPAVKTGI